MAYPYSRSETLADGAVHLAGLAFSIPAGLWLLQRAEAPELLHVGVAVYVASLIFAFAASALYHMLPFDRTRTLLGRIDHAAIYFKIAGTYTPLVILLGLGFGYAILAVVWALAAFGALAKLSFWKLDARGSLALYLGMGWLSVLLIWPMAQVLPWQTVALILVGGLIYSAGTMIYANPGIRYQFAIWHSFVLIASICLFMAVAFSLTHEGPSQPVQMASPL